MKIKKVITIIALAPFVYLFLLFIGAFSFTVLDRYVSGNNYEKKADFEISNEKYKIFIYKGNQESVSDYRLTYVTFVDKETSFFDNRPLFSIIAGLPTKILDGDITGPNERTLLYISNKNIHSINFVELNIVTAVLESIDIKNVLYDSTSNLMTLDTLTIDLSKYEKCIFSLN